MARRIMRRNQQQDFRFLRSRQQAVGIENESKRRALSSLVCSEFTSVLSSKLQKIGRTFQMLQLRERIQKRISRHRRQNHIARIAEGLEQNRVCFAGARRQDNLTSRKIAPAFAVILHHRFAGRLPPRRIRIPATKGFAAFVHRRIQVHRQPRLHRRRNRHVDKRKTALGSILFRARLSTLQFGKERRWRKIFRQAGRKQLIPHAAHGEGVNFVIGSHIRLIIRIGNIHSITHIFTIIRGTPVEGFLP